jgi:integrase
MCNINNPDEISTILAQAKWKNKTKRKLANMYQSYAKWKNLLWEKPNYIPEERIPFIPSETEIDQMIASCQHRMATILLFLKETGARIGEAHKIDWSDINLETRTVNIPPEKNSNPRILPISPKLAAMLNHLSQLKPRMLPKKLSSFRTCYDKMRQRTTTKLQNPRLLKITFHTFRHYKGTMEYHTTKDIIHVKYVLGHKDIRNTMTYINIEQAIFTNETEEFTCKTAETIDQTCKLIEAGFQYVTEMEGIKLFRKRK